jgi:pimeloyl-ACP methyl ester carboxylesterase
MTPDSSIAPARSGKAGATAYSVWGQGEAVVLVHGVGMAQDIWRPQVATLARRFQVVTYDMLGHGGSDLPPVDVTLDAYAAQLRALLDHLDLARADVVGHSMGALVALEFALSHPARIRSVAALNAVFQRSPEQRAAVQKRAATLKTEGLAGSVGPTLERWFGDPVPADLQEPAELTERLLRSVNPPGYARTYELFARSDSVHADRIPALAAPALFLTADGDHNSTPSMSHAMAALAPRGRAQVIEGARHMMTVTHPQAVNDALVVFLESAHR